MSIHRASAKTPSSAPINEQGRLDRVLSIGLRNMTLPNIGTYTERYKKLVAAARKLPEFRRRELLAVLQQGLEEYKEEDLAKRQKFSDHAKGTDTPSPEVLLLERLKIRAPIFEAESLETYQSIPVMLHFWEKLTLDVVVHDIVNEKEWLQEKSVFPALEDVHCDIEQLSEQWVKIRIVPLFTSMSPVVMDQYVDIPWDKLQRTGGDKRGVTFLKRFDDD